MSTYIKREFDILDSAGQRFLEWKIVALKLLKDKGLDHTIVENNNASEQDKAKTMDFLLNHLHERLKSLYMWMEDPKQLWDNLNAFYGEKVRLPRARHDWMQLKFQDFNSVNDYNEALIRITSLLRLCGEEITEEDMIDKTLSTMHPSEFVLQYMYRKKGFKKCSDLINNLLVDEEHSKILLENDHRKPTSFRGDQCGSGNRNAMHKLDQVRGNKIQKPRKMCHKCGMIGHWARDCYTSKHFVGLYQASLKNKGENLE